MARKKTEKEEVEEVEKTEVEEDGPGTEIAHPALSATEMMAPADASTTATGDAGLGSEDVGSNDVILPRITLLQGLSKPVVGDIPGARIGRWWTTPFNRPATVNKTNPMRFVVVRIFPSQRWWTPIDEGGGLICEAAGGQLVAREPLGLTGAALDVTTEGDTIKSIEWKGGVPTDDCRRCVYGPAAAAGAAGREPTGRGSDWLPKVITFEGAQYRVPDTLRGPRCTASLDVLVLGLLPAFEDEESGIKLGPELIPAFISFSRTGLGAGKSLAGMIKLSVAEPSWSKIYNLASKKVSNSSGQEYYIPTVQVFGYASEPLMVQAKQLYVDTREQDFRPDISDGQDAYVKNADEDAPPPPKDDEAAPADDF